jgi:hypothetical protein
MKTKPILAALLFISIGTALAEDGTRGRLPDGRAFRTDSSGIQLADYTAELEVNIEEQQRRIRELEGTIQEKDSLLLRKAGSPSPKLIEKSLVGSSSQTSSAVKDLSIADCPNTSVYTKKIAFLERELQTANTKWEDQTSNAETASSKLESKLKRTERELAQAHELLRLEKENTITQTSALQEAVTRGEVRTSFARPIDSRPIHSEKAAVRTQLNQLRGLVSTRNSKFQTYKSRQASSVSFGMSALRSRSGQTLEQLTTQLERATTLLEIAKTRAGISEIKARVSDDIALIDRMGRQR